MHETRHHCLLAACCKDSPADMPLCPHKATCVNCHKVHDSNSMLCEFFNKRNDHAWVWVEYQKALVSQTRNRSPQLSQSKGLTPWQMRGSAGSVMEKVCGVFR